MNTTRPKLINGEIQDVPVWLDEFSYCTQRIAIAAGAQATQNIAIEANSDFEWIKATFFADIAAAGQTVATQVIPLVNVLISDTGSGRQLMNTAVTVPQIFGTGQLPFIQPIKRVFKANSNITIQLTNFDAANTYNIQLALIGIKVFYL